MNGDPIGRYDVAIVGAGPVGSVCALAHARNGARVALFEANPRASRRLAGEWLHPPAVRILRDLGIALDTGTEGVEGKGFAVFPEDGSAPIVLPYAGGGFGLACDHDVFVSRLREAVGRQPEIDYLVQARVHSVEDGRLGFTLDGHERTVCARRIVGADGRASIVRQSLGLSADRTACSRMIGVKVDGASLPFEGYGHVVLGGPGPILMYRMADNAIRIIVDVPLDHWNPRERTGLLSDSYAGFLPDSIRPAFMEALHAGNFHAAVNDLRLRVTYGNGRRVLIGDAAGHYHPMTAVGMTLGLGDAFALANGKAFRDFSAGRLVATRIPEILALALYEVFADHRLEAVALRHAIYRNWRTSRMIRNRTIRMLACENTSVFHLAVASFATVASAVAGQVLRFLDPSSLRRAGDVVKALTGRLLWFLRGTRELNREKRSAEFGHGRFETSFARALMISMTPKGGDVRPQRPKEFSSPDAGPGLMKAVRHLVDRQDEDGGWEGEMAWCPMLTAQYVLLHHVMDRPIGRDRRRRLLRYFERSRLDEGVWGLHDHSAPHLFVTVLVYVALRILGVGRDDPLIEPARRFLETEDVTTIPSWGKFWLAILNLYDWRGVNPVLPELWSLPTRIVLHPSNWYCHTRLIYMAMAVIFARRFQCPPTPLTESLREELYPRGFSSVDFPRARNSLRQEDLYRRPGMWLRSGYGLARLFDRLHVRRLRAKSVRAIIRQIKWELRTTSYTSISPVSGMLNILALWLESADDADCREALDRLEGWVWEDDEHGARLTGARSASWDTGFALQALATVDECGRPAEALDKGADFLRRQQIGVSFEGYREAFRNDPRGGWCFAGGWHGWPVTDCTAEAVLGILAVDGGSSDRNSLEDAVSFMLRGQNRDGGFGSYESRRSAIGLEWLNPAEMFGDSMTEHSHVECTASCLAAFAATGAFFPEITDPKVTDAVERADAWLRRTQANDGSWRGVWGVQFIYGTFFGIRGLIAAGAPTGDPALRLACRWLLDRQHEDGGWGEHHSGCLTGRYVAHETCQVIQTAWAVVALLEAGESNWTAISRGVQFLLDQQETTGAWPRQDMAGVFFRTALLDYELYRQYFPLLALGLYEKRRKARFASGRTAPERPEGVRHLYARSPGLNCHVPLIPATI